MILSIDKNLDDKQRVLCAVVFLINYVLDIIYIEREFFLTRDALSPPCDTFCTSVNQS